MHSTIIVNSSIEDNGACLLAISQSQMLLLYVNRPLLILCPVSFSELKRQEKDKKINKNPVILTLIYKNN